MEVYIQGNLHYFLPGNNSLHTHMARNQAVEGVGMNWQGIEGEVRWELP